jgi:hypothetical protein
MERWAILALAAACALLAAGPARAAGGAHVVDDSEVETAGHCHLELWRTSGGGGSRFLDASPACTPAGLPNLELGGFATRTRAGGRTDAMIGLAPKVTLRHDATGLGLGVSGALGIDAKSKRIGTASLIVPVTVPVGGSVRVNLDGGWVWTRGIGHDAFAGVQAEAQVARTLGLMAELFGRIGGRTGAQTGLRWTVDKGRIDIDLLASRYGDGTTAHAATIGVTIRR